jgi:hypothetical protein
MPAAWAASRLFIDQKPQNMLAQRSRDTLAWNFVR